MELTTGRLESASRVKEYPSENAGEERRRRASRSGKESLLPNEDELGPPEENEVHQLDDLV